MNRCMCVHDRCVRFIVSCMYVFVCEHGMHAVDSDDDDDDDGSVLMCRSMMNE